MSAFHDASKIEKRSQRLLIPLLLKAFDSRVIETVSGSLSVELQKTAGDVMAQKFARDVIGIELKAEQKHTGNLFIETWSNKSRWNPGWIYTSLADYLLYHFLDAEICYVINMRSLKKFCFTDRCEKTNTNGLLHEYREVPQFKWNQKNDTWGRLVPIAHLESKGYLDTFWTGRDGLLFRF